jgi:pseudomonalisin
MMAQISKIHFTFIALICLPLLACCGFAQTSSAVARIVDPIDELDVVTLAGNTHPLARVEFDQGPVSDQMRLERIVLLLQPDSAQQERLAALLKAQQEPGSASYHQWLSPEEYGSRFGVSSADLAQITSWLQGHGFSIEPVSGGRSLIVFSGTAAQVADTFHTEIHRYAVSGGMHIANVQDPQIPRALAPVVAGVVSLHDFRRVSSMRAIREVQPVREIAKTEAAAPENTQGSTHYLFPADFATIYDLNPQYAAGRNGSGSSIAIVGRSNINLSDVSSFRSYAGLPTNQPSVILEGANPGLVSGDQDESTLDVEWSGAVAPGAALRFVVAASTATTDGVDLSAQYIVNHKTANAMSTSYGNCEANMGSSEMAFYNSLWQQAASEGISAFVSSGDSGAAGCNSGSSSSGSTTGVNGLCSSPYSTCVGGTEFNEGSGKYWNSANGAGGGSVLSYIPEKVWNESAKDGGSGLWSSGGGISETYAQPTWQRGVSGANSNGMRSVPDVALTAAGHDGYLICENGSWYVIAGTSAASPSFAGIMSIVDEKQGNTGQGNANPTLYGMLDASELPFHSTPSGNNSVPGVNGFTASGAAYNLATGLGSVDANLLVNGWPTSSVTQAGFTLKPSATSETLLPGKSTTFTVAVTGTGGFAGSVALTAKLPSGVTLSFSPASVKAGASATATLTVSAAAAAGTSSITITGTSGSVTAPTAVSLTIQPPPTLKISAGSAKVSVIQGEAAALSMTTTTGGVFTGAVTLAATGLPAGVTASWSGNSFSVNGVTTTVSTLTLKAASTAVLSSAAVTVTVSGDGLQAKAQCTVQIVKMPTISVSLSPATISMVSTATQKVVLTVTPAGGAKPAAGASASTFLLTGLPAGVTGSWGTSSLTSAGTLQVALTLTGSSTAITSTSKPTIVAQVHDSATGMQYTTSTQIALTVTRPNSLTASAAAVTLVLGRSKSVTDTVTISTANTFHTAVTLAISGLSTGVTASWSANPVTPNASTGQVSATLTLKASSTASLATQTVTITATGGGVTATKSISVQVTN